jgi:hypothetical protein
MSQAMLANEYPIKDQKYTFRICDRMVFYFAERFRSDMTAAGAGRAQHDT